MKESSCLFRTMNNTDIIVDSTACGLEAGPHPGETSPGPAATGGGTISTHTHVRHVYLHSCYHHHFQSMTTLRQCTGKIPTTNRMKTTSIDAKFFICRLGNASEKFPGSFVT